ncbi:MAG: TerB family tellurite resistance protein [Alphaproteobacteria bacterium]|nr:TerB family tellurite resistance protein [Alphaproteobacteria bacterium]
MNATSELEVLKALQDLSAGKGFFASSTSGTDAEENQKMCSEVGNAHETRVGVSMLVGITYKSNDGSIKEREFLIRRVIHNKNDMYIDGMAVDIKAPRLIKVSQILKIDDVGTGRKYDNPYKFLQDKLGIGIADEILPEQLPTFAKVIERLHNEITVLMYVVAIDGIREKSERGVVAKYVRSQTPDLTYSDEELDDYLISIAPDATSAGMAFQRILTKDKNILQSFIEALINVIMANGQADEKERIFLAKVLDLLESQGYRFDLGL